MNDASKNVLLNTIKEWTKFTGDREKFTTIASEVAVLTAKCLQESLVIFKSQNVEVECESPDALKLLGVPLTINPVIDAVFPNIKVSVVLKCGGATRSVLINPNLTISAGGTVVTYDQLKKGIPVAFEMNAAEFVRDAFLNVARTGGKEQ